MPINEQSKIRMFWASVLVGGIGLPFAAIIAFDLGMLYGAGYGEQVWPVYGFAVGFIIVAAILFILIEAGAIFIGASIGLLIHHTIKVIQCRVNRK